jgi:O-methyltransferase involved in polyketide biosynthesis
MMADGEQVQLGAVQETLFIPLAGRARETRKKRPILRDPKAAQIVDSVPFDASKYGKGAGGPVGVIRTAVLDVWVREFLAEHPGGTVVELGTGTFCRLLIPSSGRLSP